MHVVKDTWIIGYSCLALQLAVVCNVLHGPGVQSRVLSRLSHVLPFGVVWDLGGGLVASFSNIPTPDFFFLCVFINYDTIQTTLFDEDICV